VNVDLLRSTGAEMILANTYHLALRPGAEIVRQLGGLHDFMGWQGPILTDSGGFQIFSLAKITKVTEQAAVFRSHIDGRLIELSPERAIEIQQILGSDIAMVLDHVVPLPSPPEVGPGCLSAFGTLGSPMPRRSLVGPTRRCSRSCREGLIRTCESSVPANWSAWVFRLCHRRIECR
jgi:hypothetical protein